MNWCFYTSMTIEELVEELIKPQESDLAFSRVLDFELRSNHVLWSVVQVTFKTLDAQNTSLRSVTFINCHLIVPTSNGFTCKTVQEFQFPHEVNCPLRFLDVAPDEVCEEWRTKVRQFHLDSDVPW